MSYQIKVVSKLTGLPADTIRAWERRYAAVSPRRDGTVRLYDDQDVSRLRLLRQAVDQGHSIGRIVSLCDESLQDLITGSKPPPRDSELDSLHSSIAVHLVDDIFNSLHGFDFLRADDQLMYAATLMPPREIIHRVVAPLIQKIGVACANNELSIAHEHLSTALLRNLLGTLLRTATVDRDRRPIVLATLPDDAHELGLLLISVLATSQRFPICYLGQNLPHEELIDVCKRLNPIVLAISLVNIANQDAAANSLKEIARNLSPQTHIWLGGNGLQSLQPSMIPQRTRCFSSLEAVEVALSELAMSREAISH